MGEMQAGVLFVRVSSKSDSCVWDTTFLFSCIYDPSSHRVVSVRDFCVHERLDEVGSFTEKQEAGEAGAIPEILAGRALTPLSLTLPNHHLRPFDLRDHISYYQHARR